MDLRYTNNDFMVHWDVWETAGGRNDFYDEPYVRDMPCVPCFERRLGRALEPDDFTNCLLNDMAAEDLRSTRKTLLYARLHGIEPVHA